MLALFIYISLSLTPSGFAVSSSECAAVSPLRVALQWLPQSQFAGFYMARDQGLYTKEGIDILLIHTGPGPSSLDLLCSGQADFATMFLADAIVHSSEQGGIVHVAQLMRRSNLMLVGWKDMGIVEPSDLDGRRISYWPGSFSAAFTAFLRKHDIRPDVVPQHYSINLFLHGGVAACSAMIYNEYHRIYQAGVDRDRLTVFMMRDYGMDFPEDGIYTRSDIAALDPDLCMALRRATLEGWNYARQHPEKAVDTVLRESRKAGVPANRPHIRWMLDHVLAAVFPPDDYENEGILVIEKYEDTVAALKAAGLLIRDAPSFECFSPFEKDLP